ncbi:MAG: type III-B CRISPR module-associated protein Cmr3 [Saccharolobus sp.]|uniref:type III-B CRISPR module-associated protein Cmr3 n=1 Tax=Saccharolobus TaxID=2100760 RepID=UPI001F0F2929|nr:type III-B CRISPR module-associated protein Cmr3 [Saccharolobus shibatae]MCH4816212.1 type III-B CRISPR module-associated protein Cmr3 [Saccharolobus shibatae]
MIKKIRIKPLEPLILRSQGEFEPLVTGSHISAQSLIIPRPSTIAGLLGYLKFKGNANEDWLINLLSQLGDDVKIYGTLIEEGDDESYLYPLRMGNLFALVDIEILCQLPRILENTNEKYEEWEKEVYDIFYKKNKLFELTDFQDRIGISLDRQKKVVKEHYLYTARYLSFKKEINYAIFLEGNLELNETVANFGGERRIVKLEVEDSDDILAKDLSGDYYLAVSPILIPDDIIDSILKEDLIVMGKVDKISLGFDIAHNRRKEMLTAVLEGSIIKRGFVKKYRELANKSSYSSLLINYEKIGYNTIYGVNNLMKVRKILLDNS